MTHSPDCIAELYEGLHRLVARKERVHLSRKKDWPALIVPYTYCTIKSKCHDTCKKPSHSCKRKTISSWHHPSSPRLQGAGRLAAAWVECIRLSSECSSMKTSYGPSADFGPTRANWLVVVTVDHTVGFAGPSSPSLRCMRRMRHSSLKRCGVRLSCRRSNSCSSILSKRGFAQSCCVTQSDIEPT